MKYSLLTIGTILLFKSISFSQSLLAYYTKIERGEDWEAINRTTEHADIIVSIADGKLMFWRGTSYLPIWETANGKWTLDEVIPRSGDGPENRPDANCSFSHVRIISSNDSTAVIHWRYLPYFSPGNPKKAVNHLKFVDEYFTIQQSGHVTRTIRQGNEKIYDWINDSYIDQTEFDLTLNGITNMKSTSVAQKSEPLIAPTSQEKLKATGSSIAQFDFDEGFGDETLESVSFTKANIKGHKSYWKTGIRGHALAFDGYYTEVSTKNKMIIPSNQFTIESWVALGAYPFNWSPIAHQGEYGENGFYFGIGPSGKLVFALKTKKWKKVISDKTLPLREWTHVAATYNGTEVTLYVNGEVLTSKRIKGEIESKENNIVIGLNSHKQIPGNPVRPDCEECHTPALFGIDGLIDELIIHNEAKTTTEIQKSYKEIEASQKDLKRPDLEERELPLGPSTGSFKAHYTHLKYYDTWDNLSRFGRHADVVVEFDSLPTKFIFWRGMSYVPQIVNGDKQWYNNQFNESWDPGGSWGEPMSDKQSTRSHVRIIEDNPARKVIHWRYAQVQINGTQQNYDHESGWGDWSDWYYYIYPDGVASKRMIHWSWDDPLSHEWQETIGVMSPGQTPESISDVFGQTVFFDDLQETKSYNWTNLDPVDKIPAILEKDWEQRPLSIQLINYSSNYKPFTIGDFKGASCYGDADGEIVPYSQMVVYTHWPLGQLPTDGTRAYVPDRGSSNGYTHLSFKGYHDKGQNWAERTILEGMSDKSIAELRPLARSWLFAPKVSSLIGAESAVYDQPQRAYIIEGTDNSNDISFTLDASAQSPIENVCFVFKNWDGPDLSDVLINGKSTEKYREGRSIDIDGTQVKIVFMEISEQKTLKMNFVR